MSYLSEQEFREILDTVSIFPISSPEIGDILQYSFDCGEAEEYVSFLREKALRLEELSITKTFVLIHNITNELIGYYSLSTDTVKLTTEERAENDLSEVSFMSLPSMKLGKLAINKALSDEANRKGYGSFVLDIVNTYAYEILECGVACRFVTVDADIEYNAETPAFYEKNGFVPNVSAKRRGNAKTVSMRRDIFAE